MMPKRGSKCAEEQSADSATADTIAVAPYLVTVAHATVISFALWDGANRALTASPKDAAADASEICLGYCVDCISMTIIRLYLLLDNDPKMVSYQRIYRHLSAKRWSIC